MDAMFPVPKKAVIIKNTCSKKKNVKDKWRGVFYSEETNTPKYGVNIQLVSFQ